MSTHDTTSAAAPDASAVEFDPVSTAPGVMHGTAVWGEVGGIESLRTLDPLARYEVIAPEDHHTVTPIGQGHIEGGLELGPDGVIGHGCETKAMLFGGQDIRHVIDGNGDENGKPELSRVLCPHCGQVMPAVERRNDA